MSPSLAALRALVRTYPSALVGYSGGVDSALLAVVLRQELGRERMLGAGGRSAAYPLGPWGAAGTGGGANGGGTLRYSAGRARHARTRGPRLSRESDQPMLLLQDRAVAPARPGG